MKNFINKIKQKFTIKKKTQTKDSLFSKISTKNERLKNELQDLLLNPIMSLGLTVGLINKNNIFEWKISLVGANDTLYKLNIYTIKIEFPEIYPESPPKIFF